MGWRENDFAKKGAGVGEEEGYVYNRWGFGMDERNVTVRVGWGGAEGGAGD